MSKLCAYNNKLPGIEGRYRNISREERVCNNCEDSFVGDEFHMLFVCPNDDNVRLKDMYIPDYYKNRLSVYRYVSLMQTTRLKVLNDLALCVQAVFTMIR